MEFIFKGGVEIIRLKIDRINKTLVLATSKTNNEFIELPFWKLFGDKEGDREAAEKEQAETELLNDEEFKKKVISEFARNGYQLMTVC